MTHRETCQLVEQRVTNSATQATTWHSVGTKFKCLRCRPATGKEPLPTRYGSQKQLRSD
eukprot:CAMPEP_0117466794 /NCGR_PEP_ID=MMETSP0784-20121206/5325_1 /TAXON_ID=39447 /ORGANISM="" /LENGTH=58 /DNA_ID=CAMNT_0005260745 /DNA_START=460 /DNA_END=633 /DNA_ORIENTATION=-